MKRMRIFIIVLVLCLSGVAGSMANASEVPGDTIVYVTDTGTKYHREGCSYLKSKNKTTKQAAEAAGYEPCSRCKPHLFTGKYTVSGESTNRENPTETGDKQQTSGNKLNNGQEKTNKMPMGEIGAVVALCSYFVIAPIWHLAQSIREKQKKKRATTIKIALKEEMPDQKIMEIDDVSKDTSKIEPTAAGAVERQTIKKAAERRGRIQPEDTTKEKSSGSETERTEDYWESLLEDVEKRERERLKRRRRQHP